MGELVLGGLQRTSNPLSECNSPRPCVIFSLFFNGVFCSFVLGDVLFLSCARGFSPLFVV